NQEDGLNRRLYSIKVADPGKDLTAKLDEDVRPPIRLRGLHFPSIRQHDLKRRTRQPLLVPLNDLAELAETLDQEDRDAGRTPTWSRRWGTIRLQITTGNGLRDASSLDLSELRHLIGLPGAGKTTLIMLLCILLGRRGLRVAVFFTSIG